MKIYRYKYKKKISYGILKEENLYPLEGSPFRFFKVKSVCVPIGEVMLLPPVKPSKIVAIGVNYKDHAMERGKTPPKEPLVLSGRCQVPPLKGFHRSPSAPLCSTAAFRVR